MAYFSGHFCYLILCIGVVCVMDFKIVRSQKTGAKPEEKKTEEFKCPEGPGKGSLADPATCKRFYQCVNGYPYRVNCPSGLHFDDVFKYCTFPEEARCGPLSTTTSAPTEPPVDLATKCNPSNCSLPYCFCSKDGTEIPKNLDPEEIPQMILMTFDGAINNNNYHHYKKILNKRQNPNGCDIKATFFVAHEYSNYQMIQELASKGHEMATATISLQMGLQDRDYKEWVNEMIGMREILHRFSNISRNDVVGMRAPFLKPGRNAQYKVMEDFGYIYDSSIGIPPLPVPLWPYTLDYKIPHECKAETCPTKSFPGLWEVPLNAHYAKEYEGGHCSYLDQCVLHNHDGNEVFEWLKEDFERYYLQNKAPYVMPFHTNWFSIKELQKGLELFMNWATELSDVWFVTTTQALMWITDPKTLKDIDDMDAWNCRRKESLPTKPCVTSNKCALSFKPDNQNFTDTRYMETCIECPQIYPWLGDAKGSGIPGKDNYIPESYK